MNADNLQARKAELEAEHKQIQEQITQLNVRLRQLEGAWGEVNSLSEQLKAEGEAAPDKEESSSGKPATPSVHRK